MLDLLEHQPIKPSCCIIGEPTGMEVVIGHKGKHATRVKVRGLACHSGQSPFGVNAIDFASELIVYIRKLAHEKAQNGPFDKDYEVPYTTLHTGVKGVEQHSILCLICVSLTLKFDTFTKKIHNIY